MKLFKKVRKAIPSQIRPDYDAIARMEKEFKLDDEGFNERYDEMLFNNFKETWGNEEWSDPNTIEDKLDELWCEVSTDKYRRVINALLDEIHEERKWAIEEFDEECNNLRERMIQRGRLILQYLDD
jgi:hypothetical protein